MKLVFTAHFDIDFDKERKRVNKCFKGKEKARQLNLINLFEKNKFEEWKKAYNSLPYSESDECPEQEYVGMIFHDIIRSLTFSKFTLDTMKVVS
jgi:hypothetical protein